MTTMIAQDLVFAGICSCNSCIHAIHGDNRNLLLQFLHTRHPWRKQEKVPEETKDLQGREHIYEMSGPGNLPCINGDR